MSWESLYTWLFCIACVALVLEELFFLFRNTGFSFGSKKITAVIKISRDFRNGRYYNPWSKKPIMIEPKRKRLLELSDTPVLSQRAVYGDMFGFKHTLNKLNQNEINSRKARLFARVLQVNGPTHLADLYPLMNKKLESWGREELANARRVGSDTLSIQLAPTCNRLVSRLMSVTFFGGEMSSDPQFAEAILRYPQQVVACMGAFQVTPSFLKPAIHAILTRRGKHMHFIHNRLAGRINSGPSSWVEPGAKETILYNMIELSQSNREYWSPLILSQAVLGLWFAASFQPYINLDAMLLELCLRPEWQSILRQEILESEGTADARTLEQLPLLDSFMREVARVSALDKYAIRRKALEDYTFSGGFPFIPAGSTVCASSYEVSRNPEIYPNPEEFDGKRFVNGRSKDTTKRYADFSENHLLWGYGSLVCPGRHYASLVLKMLLAHFIVNFEMRLEDTTAPRNWSWEEFTLPRNSTRILLTPHAK